MELTQENTEENEKTHVESIVKFEDSNRGTITDFHIETANNEEEKDANVILNKSVKMEVEEVNGHVDSSSTETDIEMQVIQQPTIPKKPPVSAHRRGPRKHRGNANSQLNLSTADHQRPLYCICQKPDDGSWMLGCDGCEDWFHGTCVNIPESYNDLTVQYFCPKCTEEGKGITTWKRKCRLRECSNPTRPNSNYCSDKHGVDFFREKVKLSTVEPSAIKNLVLFAKKREEFQNLGTVGPTLPSQVPPEVVYNFEIEEANRLNAEIVQLNKEKEVASNKKIFLQLIKDSSRRAVLAYKEREGIKKDLCGFDSRLLFNQQQMNELWEKVSNGAPLSLDMSIDPSPESTCFTEKRRCAKHTSWQVIFTEDFELQESNILQKLNMKQTAKDVMLEHQKQRCLPGIQYDGYARFCHEQLSPEKMANLLK
ncbi:Set1C PHD finger subunit Spf1 [Schizosaccharomyces pombe]|uniref:Set1 complex component spp1 n=1 Tax=Schizosaccharomyces pombe (strain 972 / ATCC 24843) TaxID=284812 RepID=SPP1_SCHPO|nr:Set1C PHD Finger protein Spf1 [Schizosaccharomyces pombe]O74508.1 RecName: Full=Set1 complex component spp1; Short=Set1C component spp1; AltName: Full=COMPASS component spp1; AltName: Full=Complex proteins associated with set1 protein spp1 [Schizosaccharomyces pombe 972h-]CAA20664.1 Set1C PHD Finger protein Spf1 [Schizosaccharomyces pombe]|eukprot:NP_587791.1 Set1C PHD Finger protein Spf1 [Schizosaccharomyces pombe]